MRVGEIAAKEATSYWLIDMFHGSGNMIVIFIGTIKQPGCVLDMWRLK